MKAGILKDVVSFVNFFVVNRRHFALAIISGGAHDVVDHVGVAVVALRVHGVLELVRSEAKELAERRFTFRQL